MRTVVIGDIHGSAESLLEIVRALDVTDRKLRWTAKDTRLVFTGDLCDRGYESKTLYSMVMRWQTEAPEAGSEVYFIIGNHEVMAVWGLSYYTTREEFAGYGDGDPRLGERERRKAFSPGGWMYSWLLKQRFILRKDGIIYSHGDVPSALTKWQVDEIEEYTREAFIAGERTGYTHYNLPDPLFSDSGSLLWCREAEYGNPGVYSRALRDFLNVNQASLLICGHTPSRSGRMRVRFSGRYLCVDTAMVFRNQGFGMPSALVLEGKSAMAWYLKPGKVLQEELELRLPGSNET